MRRVFGIIMGLLGTGLLLTVFLSWHYLIERAWRFGGMAATFGFFFLLIGGGVTFIILAGIWLRNPKGLDPYEGYRVEAPDLGHDDYDDDYHDRR